jgi:hypothetical protein
MPLGRGLRELRLLFERLLPRNGVTSINHVILTIAVLPIASFADAKNPTIGRGKRSGHRKRKRDYPVTTRFFALQP